KEIIQENNQSLALENKEPIKLKIDTKSKKVFDAKFGKDIKEELGREKFIEKIWEWKEQSGGKILDQMRTLGITPAWSRLRF
ncbi:class I tRNA ligase family protein, partial [Campylobacter coli]